jgi:chitin disaccharide deacetylase
MLIVNADDFGISEGVNAAVVDAHRNGILTSATVMVNMPGFEQAVRLALANPTLGVGIHLNLTSGPPVLSPSRVSTLVDGSGRFPPGGAVLRRLSLGRLDPQELEAELNAQVERGLTAGLTATHLDSHHHLHLHPLLQPIAVRVARRFGIQGIRCTVEMGPGEAARRVGMMLRSGRPHPGHALSGDGRLRESPRGVYLKTAALSLLGRVLRARAARAGLVAPAHFRGLLLGTAFSSRDLQDVLRELPAGITELMCHPGYPDQRLRQQTSYSDGRDRELQALLEPAARRILDQAAVRLGSYSDLTL